MEIFVLLAYIVNYGLNLAFNVKNLRAGSFITKALLMPLLLLVYLAGSKEPQIPVILALFFCFLGDLFLEFPNCFLPGLSAFLVGHIFYAVRLISDIGVGAKLPWWIFLFAIVYAAYGIIFRTKLSIPNLRKRTAVYIYSAILLVVSFLSLLRFGSVTGYSFWMVLVGTLLFICSDSILAYNMFQKRSPNGTVWVMATYGAAQLMIILGL
ncbi:MAG: lysoplasmalogenase [Clostridiaceae bacterium]|nr:lysoplasmalogenase [Clostridiaceae bacterium]